VSSVRPAADGRERLLSAASPGTGGDPLRPNWGAGLASSALHSLRSVVRNVHADLLRDAGYAAWGRATIRRPSGRLALSSSRQERWQLFSFGVMMLALIR
jgi:hypothetical protein